MVLVGIILYTLIILKGERAVGPIISTCELELQSNKGLSEGPGLVFQQQRVKEDLYVMEIMLTMIGYV